MDVENDKKKAVNSICDVLNKKCAWSVYEDDSEMLTIIEFQERESCETIQLQIRHKHL